MVVVRIEMWPGGKKENARPLAPAILVNDGTGTQTMGNYHAEFGTHRAGAAAPTPFRGSTLKGYPRARLNVWFLLARLLAQAGIR